MASSSSQIIPFSSNSTSTPTPTPYEVFLSFRGADTRFGFTSHLYNSLFRYGIRTFIDDPELRSGEVISSRLIQAIQESKIYVIVLSENYASSTWCLDELVEIVKCCKEFGRLVIPIFYKIDPFVVRHQIGSFKAAFEKHEDRFGGEMDKLNNWRYTLQEVANISGYHVFENRHTRSEAEITNEVVDRILLQIKPVTLEVATYPVSLISRTKDITSLLNKSGGKGLTIIGIYGMGGIGKTTLAKAVFNEISPNFGGSSFLSDVREISGTVIGLVSLQQQLIDELLRKKIYTVHNVSEGYATIKERLCSTKVLVIIDDLDKLDQFESLVGPFSSGSVIIVTTRKEDLLVTIGVEPRYRYMLEKLDKADSWKLFRQHSFGDNIPSDTFTDLSKEILQHAGGLPLALKVFGSNLRNQSEAEWRRFIGELQESVNHDILKKLMISFDALVDYTLKEMFLDIACFFVGEERENVVYILGSSYSDVGPNIDRLKSRCLITIDKDNRFSMHDLLRDMGREIARQNSPKDEPEKHSRLSGWQDIYDVLDNKKGTGAIKGMVHHYSLSKADEQNYEVTFDTETFKQMSKLRFLKIKLVNLRGSFEHAFKDLRWLQWSHCPLQLLPSDFCPEKLVILELFKSKIRMWEQTKNLNCLKILVLSNSEELLTTPDFSRLPSLEVIVLHGCIKLEKVDITIGSLLNLVSLDLEYCTSLKSLPCNLRALDSLNIGDCYSLEVPEELGNIESLIELSMERLTISKLPYSIGHLSKVVWLRLGDNKNLETLPDICNMSSLEILDISGCEKLDISPHSNLQLPPNLKQLMAISCKSLSRLPDLSNLKRLETLFLINCSTLREVEGFEKLISIRKLYLEGCNSFMLANTLTESLFQTYSEFGNEIRIQLEREDYPDWISRLSFGSRKVQTHVSRKFLGLLLSLACPAGEDYSNEYLYTITNRTSGLMYRNRNRTGRFYFDRDARLVVVLLILPIKHLVEYCGDCDEDTIFEVTSLCQSRHEGLNIGVHSLYKP